MGCNFVELTGNSAANVKQCQLTGKRDCVDLPVLGPDQYDLMVIGGGPSLDDDAVGVVFQDNAGGLITEWLEKAGADMTRVYMTHITKCRPRAKRKPTVQEANLCRDEHLRKEIELIQPKVVVVVGALAIRAFNLGGYGGINQIHGKIFDEKFAGWEDGPTFKVIPSVNPALFFFKPNDKFKARVANDYRVAVDAVNGKVRPVHFTPETYHLID
jgi:DNA polymerase